MKAFDNLVLKPCSLKDHTTQYAKKKLKKGCKFRLKSFLYFVNEEVNQRNTFPRRTHLDGYRICLVHYSIESREYVMLFSFG